VSLTKKDEIIPTVTGMAVLLDDQKPLACRCRLTRGEPGIFLRSESRDSSEGKIISAVDANVVNCQDLRGFNDPSSPAALLKCALVIMGIVSPTAILDESSEPIATALQGFFRVDFSVRLEIISTSLLPQGSGMGTSSILAGCILAAIAHCRGRPLTTERLIHLVLLLEQCLTTGGGFQDQANGLVGGVKRVSCAAVCPVRITWKKLLLTPSTEKRLNDRICIVFTGKTRLAKNILQQCLQRWSERTVEICRTVSDLESTAEVASRSLEDGDLERLGRCLTEYWGQKKVMAGAASGVEPTSVGSILDILYQEKLIRGASLCGAGGGGFLVLLMKDDTTREDMTTSLYRSGLDTTSLSWHGSRIDNEGLSVRCPDEDDFELSWMQGASPVDAS
jgi:fucokinase